MSSSTITPLPDKRACILLPVTLAGCLLVLAGLLSIQAPQSSRAQAADAGPARAARAALAYSYTAYLPFTIQPVQLPWAIIATRQQSRDYFLAHYVSSTATIPISWTGSLSTCSPGTTNPVFQGAVLRRINFYRALAGVPANMTFDAGYNQLTQAAALMMSRNSSLSHSPPPTWACYSSDGASGAGSSNLALGANGTAAINLYMQDSGASNSAVGHRRWILYPQTQAMGTGDVPGGGSYWAANSLHAWDTHYSDPRPPTREPYVAWPPPGYVPYQVVSARWSFSYPQANFTGAVVTMTQGGTNITVTQVLPANGYGENTLVWIPLGLHDSDPWPTPQADMTYRVGVSNVVVGGQNRSFFYDVTVFDPAN